MANTTTASANVVTRYLSDFYREYIRGNLFAPYTGTGSNNPIVIKEGRQTVSIPLISALSGGGVSGNATLDGNEEILANYAYTLTPTYKRNAVRMSAEEREKPNIDLMRGAREALMDWGMEKVRDEIIKNGLGSLQSAGTTVTVDDTTAAINTTADLWVVDNSDRVLYGAATGNLSAGDHSASLANVDTTNDKLTGDVVRLARKIARTADPLVRPIRTSNGVETYVMFVGTQGFIHLQEDLETLHSNAGMRGEGNPLFRPGDLIWDNVVIREVPEISTLLANSTYYATAGNGSSKVEPAFLCGAQAVGYGLGQRPNIVVDREKDYKFQPGVAVELKHEIDKLVYNSKDHGVVSVFVTGE
jgi:hypothetical protein